MYALNMVKEQKYHPESVCIHPPPTPDETIDVIASFEKHFLSAKLCRE